MNRLLYIFCFFLNLSFVLSQNISDKTISVNFDQTSAEAALEEIEKKSGLNIYFKTEWLDSLVVSGSFEDLPVQVVLNRLFAPYKLYSTPLNGNLYLTKKTPIITKYPLSEQLREGSGSNDATVSESQADLIFAERGIEENPNDKVYVIGERSITNVGETAILSGQIVKEDGVSPIIGATIYTEDKKFYATTDVEGFFSLKLPIGRQSLVVRSFGYLTQSFKVIVYSDGELTIPMAPSYESLNEVIIYGNQDEIVTSAAVGRVELDMEDNKEVPMLLGEADPLRLASTKAGISSAGEGAAGLNVRGGKADQNLFLLNGAPIYQISHFLGFFSAVNAKSVQNMTVYTGSMPSKYGSRLSSVFDIEGKAALQKEWRGDISLSPVSTIFTIQAPLKKEEIGLMVSGRTTYANWVSGVVDNSNFQNTDIAFWDGIVQYDHRIGKKDRIRVSGYQSQDQFNLDTDTLFFLTNFRYRNQVLSLQWFHEFNDQFSQELKVYNSLYDYQLSSQGQPTILFDQFFSIEEFGVQSDYNYEFADESILNFGAGVKQYQIQPGKKLPKGDSSQVETVILDEKLGYEPFIYAEWVKDLSTTLQVTAGLRYSDFYSLGSEVQNQYEPGQAKDPTTIISQTVIEDGEIITRNPGLEYRLSSRLLLNTTSSVKLSAFRTRQYINMLSNAASANPTDIWVMPNEHVQPQISDQVSLGYYQNLRSAGLNFSVEGYLKTFQNLVDFKTGANFLLNEFIEQATLQGPGRAYGVEFSMQKFGRLNGWLNYTYSRTFIQLQSDIREENFNGGAFYPTGYDQPHRFNLVGNYAITKRIKFSTNVAYSSGRPITAPSGYFRLNSNQYAFYELRNNYRIPDYFRVDIGVTLGEEHKLTKKFHTFWNLSIYNVIGRNNAYSVFFDQVNGNIQAYQLSIFPSPIPTLSLNIRF
jgi:hypothetical protein